MLGWSTRSFPQLQVSHYRFTGAADGAWKDSVKNGFANYVTGYHLCSCSSSACGAWFKILFDRLAGAGLGLSQRAILKRAPRVQDPALITYTRSNRCDGFCFWRASGSSL